jgi:hypothetical protein
MENGEYNYNMIKKFITLIDNKYRRFGGILYSMLNI